MGFKEIISRTVKAPDALARLITALNDLREIGGGERGGTKQVTQFSDSIVVSYRTTDESAAFWIMNEIAWTVIRLVERGYLLRGAVTVGDLYHTSEHMLGPAMVKAYKMETMDAKFPRVVIDPKLVSVARASPSPDHSPDDEEEYVRHFMTKDRDGQFYVDYVSWKSVVEIAGGDFDGYPRYLQLIGNLVENGLRHPDNKVVKKYLWLHKKYSTEIRNFEKEPKNSKFRIEESEVYDAVVALPKFDALASEARTRLDR
jgi:hypothetical protein